MMLLILPILLSSLKLIACESIAEIESLPLCITGSTPYRLADTCAPGWYCPLYDASNSSTYPVQCAATDDCLLDRLATAFCDRQCRYEPILCKEGYYCPTPTEQIKCPADHFCPIGQSEPRKCGSLTSCPAGSSKRTDLSSLLALFLTDFGVIMIWLLRRMIKHGKYNEEALGSAGKDKSYTAIANSEGHEYPPFPPTELRINTPFRVQIYLATVRNLWKQASNTPSFYLEMGLALLAGGMMGGLVEVKYQGVLSAPYTLLSPTPLEGLIGSFFFSVGLALSLASASAGVSVFGEEMHIYVREVAAGHNHLAYFIGTNIAQIPKVFVCGLHFAFIFHIVNQCLTPFSIFFPISFLLYFAIYGLACIVSMLVSRKNAPLLAVIVVLRFNDNERQYFSASRWATEAIFSSETEPYIHIMEVIDVSAKNGGYTIDRVNEDLIFMFLVGIFYRLLAYLCMLFKDRRIIIWKELFR